jgi:hypothetical protein
MGCFARYHPLTVTSSPSAVHEPTMHYCIIPKSCVWTHHQIITSYPAPMCEPAIELLHCTHVLYVNSPLRYCTVPKSCVWTHHWIIALYPSPVCETAIELLNVTQVLPLSVHLILHHCVHLVSVFFKIIVNSSCLYFIDFALVRTLVLSSSASLMWNTNTKTKWSHTNVDYCKYHCLHEMS